MIEFTHMEKCMCSEIDVHHVMEKRIAKRYGLNPYFYFNQVLVPNYYHINKLTGNFSAEGKKAQENLYNDIMDKIYEISEEVNFKITTAEIICIKNFYRYCTVEMFNKEYWYQYNSAIEKGYKTLVEMSEMMKRREDEKFS